MRARVVRGAVLGAVAMVAVALPSGAAAVVEADPPPGAGTCVDLDVSMWLPAGEAVDGGQLLELYLLSCATGPQARSCLGATWRRGQLGPGGSPSGIDWEAYWRHMGELLAPQHQQCRA